MKMLFAALGVLLSTVCHAQEMRVMPKDHADELMKRLHGWAQTYYPGMLQEKKLPDDLILGFLVDRRGNVLRHSAGFKRTGDGETIPAELERLFPGSGSRLSNSVTGGECFLATQLEPAFCVVYGYVN